MARFAKMNGNNVIDVVVVHDNECLDENGNESEAKGIEFLKKTFGQDTEWLQTSFGSKNGKHYHIDPNTGAQTLSADQSKCFRKTYAGAWPGFTYDPAQDAFIPPKTGPTWIFDSPTWRWIPPTPYPDDGNQYSWNEDTQTWDLV